MKTPPITTLAILLLATATVSMSLANRRLQHQVKVYRFPPACHHDGSLTSIVESNTLRVSIADWTKQDTVIGVCKLCGVIVDETVRGTNFLSHFPWWTEKQKREADEMVRMTNIYYVLANWTLRDSTAYLVTNRTAGVLSNEIWRIGGVQNGRGRLLVIGPSNEIWNVTEFQMPRTGSTIILQGDNGLKTQE